MNSVNSDNGGLLPIEVMRVPVVSTCHLTELEAAREACDWPTHVLESEDSFICYFGTARDLRNVIANTRYEMHDWEGFLAAAEWAERNGFEWIRFDRDGERRSELPSWEW